MKLSEIAKGRPIICRFDDLDDSHGGVITKEPAWQENPYDSATEMLVVMLEDKGLIYELRVRSQMVDAVRDAVAAAGAESLEIGGYLSVTFTGYRGKLKLYAAVYEPPGAGRGSVSTREPVGAAALEFGPDDSEGDSGDDVPLW
jgi:hypothetical protein